MNKFIFIENPIICTYTNNNDKKINELKKFSHVINLKDIKLEIYKIFFNFVKNKIDIKIELKSPFFKNIVNECENDIRKFIQTLENIFLYYQKNNTLEDIDLIKIKNLNDTTKNDIQLINAVNLFLNNKLDINKLDILFYLEPYHYHILYIKI